MIKKWNAFVVLCENKIISYAYGNYFRKAPKIETDQEMFALNNYKYTEAHYTEKFRRDTKIKLPKTKTEVKRYAVDNLEQLAEKTKKFSFHPSFIGYNFHKKMFQGK